MQELVERDNVSCLIGPLATAEALAIDDYIRDKQIPTLERRGRRGHDQRKANPWFVRATSTSAQCSYAMGDYAAKELKYKRVAMIADDIAYGYELNAGFQRAFEDAGGKVVQKLWPPLNAPDYGTYIAQLEIQRRRDLHRLRGLERIEVPAPVQGIRRQDSAARRHDGDRRVAAAADGRRGARLALDLLVFGAARQRVEQEARRRHAARLQGRSRFLRGRDLHQRRGARGRPEADRRRRSRTRTR